MVCHHGTGKRVKPLILHLSCRRWRVISHPLNTNPFPGSFLNCKARLRLRDVTISKVTMLELENEFDTEHMVILLFGVL